MPKGQYHHGDLRRQLIEQGILMLNTHQVDQLSLRKVAANCNVSNAAPYAHFKNKEEFILAMQHHVLAKLTERFLRILDENGKVPEVLPMLGEEYVLFFIENPLFYKLLFSKGEAEIHFSLSLDVETTIKPFEILKEVSLTVLSDKYSNEVVQDKILTMWATVHGLAGIMSMTDDINQVDATQRIRACLSYLCI
ncbi:hypothetical protein BAU15_07440 [Enterococcus sp. JM4C]|uniref:TetR/AcrR family transcriptional regulator n=1 Tax=Candidatus Enterococcus huntleyi TaxID=1857217 RepID=UPI00137943BB|nr:TetR/AcrR family transcriptional regulator [Enterococcus sp. JM4C]KAF1297538.1 hypothetical protein BAU15_07440 [Enterococcus sp. JM4C]